MNGFVFVFLFLAPPSASPASPTFPTTRAINRLWNESNITACKINIRTKPFLRHCSSPDHQKCVNCGRTTRVSRRRRQTVKDFWSRRSAEFWPAAVTLSRATSCEESVLAIDLLLYGSHLSRLVCPLLNIHFYLNIVSYITECKWSRLSFCLWGAQLVSPLVWPLSYSRNCVAASGAKRLVKLRFLITARGNSWAGF